MSLIKIFKRFVDTSISITDDSNNNINIIKENIVCLTISNFMFSFLLSLIIDLYNLNPLTAKANVAGIKIKFCSTKLNNVKSIPFPIPKIDTHTDIVYPKQNPL